MKKHIILFLSLFAIVLSSCQKADVTSEQAAIDDAKIQAYIKAHNITAIKDASGLYYQVIKPGTGTITANSNVQLTLTNSFLNGITFDHIDVTTYKLSSMIKGLQIGLPHIGTGGRIVLLVPSALGYGNTQQYTIPANTVFLYTVDVIGFY